MQDGTPATPPSGSGDQQSQQPQRTPEQEAAYWKQVALDNRSKAEAFTEYEVLIEHMNNNPDHVEQFQQIATGQAQAIAVADALAAEAGNRSQQMSEDDRLAAEIGLPTGAPMPEAQPAQMPAQPQMSVQEAERIGALRERTRIELEQFKTSMMSEGGLGEHMIDEFTQWLRKPDGLNYHDLFAAWRSNKARVAGADPLQPGQGEQSPEGGSQNNVMPQTVGALPGGESNRPGHVVQDGDGEGRVRKHVTDPSNI